MIIPKKIIILCLIQTGLISLKLNIFKNVKLILTYNSIFNYSWYLSSKLLFLSYKICCHFVCLVFSLLYTLILIYNINS